MAATILMLEPTERVHLFIAHQMVNDLALNCSLSNAANYMLHSFSNAPQLMQQHWSLSGTSCSTLCTHDYTIASCTKV